MFLHQVTVVGKLLEELEVFFTKGNDDYPENRHYLSSHMQYKHWQPKYSPPTLPQSLSYRRLVESETNKDDSWELKATATMWASRSYPSTVPAEDGGDKQADETILQVLFEGQEACRKKTTFAQIKGGVRQRASPVINFSISDSSITDSRTLLHFHSISVM
jgi:hypothetical protein